VAEWVVWFTGCVVLVERLGGARPV